MTKQFTIIALALAALCSCTKDNEQNISSPIAGEKVYMQFSVAMPATKSTTDSAGTTNSDADPDNEAGKEYENTISSVDLEFHNTADGSVVTAQDIIPLAASADTYVASFNTLDLVPGASYRVYVYANCQAQQNPDAVYSISTDNIDQTVARSGNFMMTNAAAPAEQSIPSDLSLYTQATTPLNIGTHSVERAVARFDYKAATDGNLYTVGSDATGATTVRIRLTDVALINMSRSFHYLRRTSADGTDASWTIGGVETASNYVVDSDWADKLSAAGNEQTINENNFLHPMTASPSTWEFTALSSLDEQDSWDGETGEYLIWRYATENTIPGTDNQIKGITTGIVFKGRIEPTEAAPAAITEAMNAGDTIYVFNNVLYGAWSDVRAAATTSADPALTAAVNQVESTDEARRTAQTYAAAGFTGYTPDSEGNYNTLYYYWNRHNDNGNNGTMGPMEFAVVRNNVYKLSVDDIARFGHPEDPDSPDPNPEEPDEPDEELDHYFNVNVRIVPWTVRINHIEF